jgi:hypothetical protein
MKFIVATILTALLAYAGGFFLPWWSIAIAAALVAFFVPQKAGWAFLSGFLGIGALWFLLSFVISAQNEGILANRISELILQKQSAVGLMAVTALIGALVGGFGAMTGSLLKGVVGAKEEGRG